MALSARTPDGYGAVSAPASHTGRSHAPSTLDDTFYLSSSAVDFGQTQGQPAMTSPLAQSMQPTSTLGGYEDTPLSSAIPSRSGTLKKKNSLSRRNSLKRSSSRKSMRAGSIKGISSTELNGDTASFNSIFFTPVPTTGTPTEILSNRFQAWRKFLKDLVAYFREIQNSYEQRSKALLKVSNVVNNTNAPTIFLSEGGLNEANRILRDYHKQAIIEANKARDIENDVVLQLNGLRADLGSKIKEIKSLAGDFKNSVEKEKEGTRRAVAALEDALHAVDIDATSVVGKGDPYVVRLGVERQVERQIDEENYLHRAYLNLENSGRELESIVVGEIQKAYNALAGILKRDADEAYDAVERLRTGPIGMAKDHEWVSFVSNDPHFVSPDIPLRRVDEIEYPGKHHPAAQEVRAGTLERKSKYLKSYTPGWYVLSPTHLHEFKSPDYIYTQPPVMSLCLLEQKLGSHSQPGASSHKFSLKGKQTGSMHRGHSWVFRAESYETMMAWYNDIRALTEGTGEQRSAFVRKHVRSLSGGSHKASSISGDSGMEEDEADEIPYSGSASLTGKEIAKEEEPRRPQPGGRFPSDIQVDRHLHAPLSPSSGSSDHEHERGEIRRTGPPQNAADPSMYYVTGAPQASDPPAARQDYFQYSPTRPQETDQSPQYYGQVNAPPAIQAPPVVQPNSYSSYQNYPATSPHVAPTAIAYPSEKLQGYPKPASPAVTPGPAVPRQQSQRIDWQSAVAGSTAAGATTAGVREYFQHRQPEKEPPPVTQTYTYQEPPQVPPNPEPPVVAYQGTGRALPEPVPSYTIESYTPVISHQPERKVDVVDTQYDGRPSTAASISTLQSSAGEVPFGFSPPHSVSTHSSPSDGDGRTHTTTQYDYKTSNTKVAPSTENGHPSISRKNTDISIGDLHIPGEFPKSTPAQ